MIKKLILATAVASVPVFAHAVTITTELDPDNPNAIEVGDVFTVQIDGDASDGGGDLSYELVPGTDVRTMTTISLNPDDGFIGAMVSIVDSMDNVLGELSDETLELTVDFMAGESYGLNILWSDVARNGSDYDVRIEASVIPVPAAGLLLIGGLGALAAVRRKKS